MRGKTRIDTRYNKFREDILNTFSNASREPGYSFSHLIFYLENQSSLETAVKWWCDKDECLLFDKSNPATAFYQVLRIANKPVLLRDLDSLAETIWGSASAGKDPAKTNLSAALSVLIGVNLIDYGIVPGSKHSVIDDRLQFFIKEDE
jgi:hypothetical protein